MNDSLVADFAIMGEGKVTLPEGMTQEEADRLCREADEERKVD